jgi:hypothetical protein
MIKRVRLLINEQLDKALVYPSEVEKHIGFARHLLNKYPDTGTRVTEEDEQREFNKDFATLKGK